MVAGGVGLAPFAASPRRCAPRHVGDAVLRRAQRRRAVLSRLLQRARRRAGADDRGRQRRRARPHHRAARSRGCPRDRRPTGVMIYACGPEGMLAATATTRGAHGRPCEVSVERIMGCGMGGCYSCVVPMRGDDRRSRHHVRSCLADRSRRPIGSCGTDAWRTDGPLGSHRLAHPQEPADGRERLLRLRRRVRRRWSICRRSAAIVSRGCSSPRAKAIRRRASSRRRPAC